MKIAKTLSIIFTVIAIMVLAISCDTSPISNNELFNEDNSLESSKSIFINVDYSSSNIEYFRYKFTPYFSNIDGSEVQGSTEGLWVTAYDFPTEWNIFFQQGKWNIQIEMYDSSDNIIGEGLNEDVFFNKTSCDLSKTFSEWLVSNGTGSISFEDIVIPKLYSLPSRYEMTGNGDSKEIKNYYVKWSIIKNGEIKYSGDLDYCYSNEGLSTFGNSTVSNIPVGYYTLSLVIYEGLDSSTSVSVGGEIADIIIFRNCISKVNALIDTSDYIHSTFRAKQTETGYTGKIKATYSSGSSNAKLELIAENATDIKWYQNGVYKSEYGNGTTANVSDIKTGSLGVGLLGTCSNYFDCVFTNSETGLVSSCSYVLVAAGRYSSANDDSSVFSLETGNEIKSWRYTATPINSIGESFGKGNGTTDKVIYLDERMWTIYASALNNKGIEIGNGTFIGYINKSDNVIDIPLDGTNGDGWVQLDSIVSSRLSDVSSTNRTISWTITDMSTGNVLSECTGSSTSYTETSNNTWKFNINKTYKIPNGTYKVSLSTKIVTGNFLTRQTHTGFCTVIINVHTGITTLIQGTLTTNYLE